MSTLPGVKIVFECNPNSPPATGANPWKAEIDFGHTLHVNGSGGAGTHSRSTTVAASLSALCTAIQTTCTAAGIT